MKSLLTAVLMVFALSGKSSFSQVPLPRPTRPVQDGKQISRGSGGTPTGVSTNSSLKGVDSANGYDLSSPSTPAPPSIALNSLGPFLGLRVAEIKLQGALDAKVEELLKKIAQKVNEPLDRNKLRNSVQTLYASGKFSDIQVEADKKSPTEITLTFVTKENSFLGGLWLSGAPGPPSSNQLLNATKLNLGDPFSEPRIKDGIERIKQVMEANGYYQSAVTARYEFKPDVQQVYVWFNVERGKHAHIGMVSVTGNSGYPEDEIREIANIHPGEEVTVARVTRALTRLRKKYQKQDRLEAQVVVASRKYHPESDRLDYAFAIERGPKVDVTLQGAKLRKGLVKKYVPIYEENAVDDDLLNEGRRNLRDYFQTQGYFDAKVNFSQTPGADLRTVEFSVDKGEKHTVVDLTIRGNKYFDTDTLRERMQIQPADILLRHGRFSQTYLVRDKEAIENLYKANGFQQAKVTPEVQDDFAGKIGQMRIVFTIEEGPQTRVVALKMEGVKAFPQDQILNLLSTTEGQPYSDQNISSDRDSVLAYYYDRGFPNVQFEASAAAVANDATKVDLHIKITEGEQVFVGGISIAGLNYTRPYIVNREFRIHAGDPLSQSDMLDTQRRLYDLSLFNQVDMATENPDGKEPAKTLLFQLDEAKRYTFTYGIGFEAQTGSANSCRTGNIIVNGVPRTTCTNPQGKTGFSPRVSFDATRINFLGRDHTLTFRSRLGNIQQFGLLSYEAPRLFNRENWSINFTSFYDNSKDVLTFSAQRLEGSLQARQQFSKATVLIYRYSYRSVKVDPNSINVSDDQIPILSRPARIGIPSFSYVRDTRDYPLDSRKGELRSVDLGLAGTFFGSQANFSRILLQESTYHSFDKKKWVFARSTRFGIEHPFGKPDAQFVDLVPLPERFFSGGSNSHRGFALNQAGPRDVQTGFPLGGNALFLNNLELRTPPILLPYAGDNLSAAIFHDMGNVFASSSGVLKSLFRFSQPHQELCNLSAIKPCDFNYLSHGVGAGLRYRTPIGPLRVDFGYNLNPPTFPVKVDPTIRGPHMETLNRFNFYFSFGQTF